MKPEPTAAKDGTQPEGKPPAARRRAQFNYPRWLRRHLWWGLLAVAVGSLIAFLVAVFWYRPEQYSRQPTLLALGGVSIVAWIGLGLWKIPQWQARAAPIEEGGKTRFEIENEARQTLGGIVSGLGVVAGLLFTWYQINDSRNATQESLRTTQHGQITSRFSQAVDQLGSNAVDVRVGGIYSLEQIALESPEEFYRPVMEVLAGYVRTHDRYVELQPDTTPAGGQATSSSLDVSAALRVITRRSVPAPGSGELHLDLSGIDLRNVPLANAHLEGVNLSTAHLEGADLNNARLEGADLSNTFVTGMLPARFKGACLDGANLTNSNITPGLIEAAIVNDLTILPDGTFAVDDEEVCD